MIEILGRFLTPMLLCCLALIVLFGLDIGASLNPSNFAAGEIPFRGLKEGYNTMDLIAPFFFSASVIEILKKASGNEELSLKKAFKASVVGIVVLAAVYIGLISLSAYHAATLQDVPKDQLLVHIAKSVLGSRVGHRSRRRRFSGMLHHFCGTRQRLRRFSFPESIRQRQ